MALTPKAKTILLSIFKKKKKLNQILLIRLEHREINKDREIGSKMVGKHATKQKKHGIATVMSA